jgi:hypothetical protein
LLHLHPFFLFFSPLFSCPFPHISLNRAARPEAPNTNITLVHTSLDAAIRTRLIVGQGKDTIIRVTLRH